MDNMRVGVDKLSPLQRFIFEYGLFVFRWNDFEYLIEALAWHLRTKVLDEKIGALRHSSDFQRMRTWEKRHELKYLLRHAKRQEVVDLMDRVYEVADRNEWIHSVMLSITVGEDLKYLFRLRVDKEGNKWLHFKGVDLDTSPFMNFHEALAKFEEIIEVFGIDDLPTTYLNSLSADQVQQSQ